MEETISDFMLLSGVITEDIENGSVNIPLDDNYTLICKEYEILQDNKIIQTFPLSKLTSVSLEGIGAFSIKTKGEVQLVENQNFIDLLKEICSRTTPFTLNIGSQSFSNIIMNKYRAKIDSYGVTASCELVFTQLSEE